MSLYDYNLPTAASLHFTDHLWLNLHQTRVLRHAAGRGPVGKAPHTWTQSARC